MSGGRTAGLRGQTVTSVAVALVLVAVAGVMCVAAYRPAQPWVNQDVAMNLFSGTEILHGAVLYVDWHDTNPPAIHVLSASLVGLAQWTRLPPVLVYHLFVLGLFASSAVLLLRNLRTFGPRRVAVLAGAFAIVLLRPTLLRFEDFGQREHLWLISFFPVVMLRLHSLDDSSRHFQLHAGMVGLASGFKPHFVVLVVVQEWLLRQERRQRPWCSRLAFCAGVLAPFCVLAWLSPPSLRGMCRDAALTMETYAHLGRPPLWQALVSKWAIMAVTCTAAGLISVWKLGQDHRVSPRALAAVRALLLLNLGCVFVQGKYLDYHWIPSIALGFLLLVWSAVNAGHPALERAVPAGVVALLAVSLFDLRTMFQPYRPPFPFHRLIRRGENVMLFSTSIWAIRPLYLDGAVLTGPWFMQFALPALAKQPLDEGRQALLTTLRVDLQARLDAGKPELLMFEEPERWFLANGETIWSLVSWAGVRVPRSYAELSERDLQACCGGRHGWRIYRRR